MRLVVDASALAAWLMPDEAGQALEAPLAEAGSLHAPGLLWAELRNILLMGERRGRLPEGLADEMMAAVDAMAVEMDHAPDGAAVMALARTHGLTIYDALYLELALRLGARLLTRDRALQAAALAENALFDL